MSLYQINAGKYRHIVTLQKSVATSNAYGEKNRRDEDNWEDVVKIRAAILPISGKDKFGADMITTDITHRIQMRFLKGIDSHMRIKFGDRIFDIVSPPINFQEKNIEIQLMCKERI